MSSRRIVHMWKLLSLFSVALLVLIGVSACGQQSSDGDQGSVTLGASLPLKGDFSDTGTGIQKGLNVWAKYVNSQGGLLGKTVKVDVLDDGGDAKQVKTNIDTLIHTHHDTFILGESISTLERTGTDEANRYSYPYVAPGGLSDVMINGHFKNLFSVSLPTSDYLTSFAHYILSLPQNQRPQSVAYSGQNFPFEEEQLKKVQNIFGTYLKSFGVGEYYSQEVNDYTPFAQKIVNANADIVVLGTGSSDECGAFIKTFKQQHYNPKAIICSSGPDEGANFIKAVGGVTMTEGVFVPNGGWYPSIKSFENDKFVSTYKDLYGGSEDEIPSDASEAFAACQVLGQAVKTANSFDLQKVTQALRNGSFETLHGTVKFDGDGKDTTAIPFLFQWQNGHLVAVYPQNEAQANPEYPKADWK